MGVIKVSEKANITATKKGRSLTSIIDDKLITTGVNNAAVALLEIRLVDINVIRYNRLKVICGLYWPNVFCIKSAIRSEEHTSELQSRENLVCRLLLEKKKHANATKSKTLTAVNNT